MSGRGDGREAIALWYWQLLDQLVCLGDQVLELAHVIGLRSKNVAVYTGEVMMVQIALIDT